MNHDDCILGKDVTNAAQAKGQRGTTVISVRLSTDEVARLEQIGRLSGKTISQIVRDAILAYELRQHEVTWSLPNGSVVSIGESQRVTWGDLGTSQQEPSEDAPSGTLFVLAG